MPSTQELAETLLESAPEREGWSLIEATNAQLGFDKLLEWARECHIVDWSRDLRIRRPYLALVLLWLESEVARRHASEGSLWPVLSNPENVPWADRIHNQLFTETADNRYTASKLHRDLLREAALHFHLRHTFEDNDGQNWYRLVYLQFGFTYDDAVQRLAPWLSGQVPPVSVQNLLEAEDEGARAFQQIWSTLRMFRLGNLRKDSLLTQLRTNPWILSEWVEDLIKAAKKSSSRIQEIGDADVAELSFFTAPRLTANDWGEARFSTNLCNLDLIGLDADQYEFRANDQILARLIRQETGGYASNMPDEIQLPHSAHLSLSLVDTDGRIAKHDETILWGVDEDITVYSKRTGKPFKPNNRIRPGTAIFIICPKDIEIQPTLATTSLDLPLGYQIHSIPSGWERPLKGFLDGEELVWASSRQAQADLKSVNDVTAHFIENLDLRKYGKSAPKPPWNLGVRFHIPSPWQCTRLRWRRGDGHLVELDTLPSQLSITERDAVRPIILRLRLTNGSEIRSQVVQLNVPLIAILQWNDKGAPYHHRHDQNLIVQKAEQSSWSFHLPNEDNQPIDPRSCSFIEGNLLHERLKRRPAALPRLNGYGAPLRIVEDPYQQDEPLMVVAPCVINGGIIGSVKWDQDHEGLRIKSSFTELGEEHQLHVWHAPQDGEMRVEELDIQTLESLEDGWLWKPGFKTSQIALTLTFRGTNLGSWFDHRWTYHLLNLPEASTRQIAALLRAWKAPLLKQEQWGFNTTLKWFSNNWCEILLPWLSAGSVEGPNDLTFHFEEPDPGWLSVVREFLAASVPAPTAEQARKIVESTSPGQNHVNALGATIFDLTEKASPLLAIRVAKAYMQEYLNRSDSQLIINQLKYLPQFEISDERADQIARIHGDRDGFWLKQTTIPSLHSIENNRVSKMPLAYRLLCHSQDYRQLALGKWLNELT